MAYSATLLMIFTAFLAASLMSRFVPVKLPFKIKDRMGHIDGLRGYLALAVMSGHYMVTYYWKTNGIWKAIPEYYLDAAAHIGISVFFMITGFLFISKILSSARVDWGILYKSRLFRIYPLYIFAILIMVLIKLVDGSASLRVSPIELAFNIMTWLLFIGGPMNGDVNAKYIIAGVHWTLRYECMFYVSLPIIALILKQSLGIKWMFVAIIILISYHPLTLYSLTTIYLFHFLVGGIVAYLRTIKEVTPNLFQSPILSVVALLMLAGAFYLNALGLFIQSTFLSVFFAFIALGSSMFGALSHRGSIFLGEISYSIYLMHGIVLYLIFTDFAPNFIQTHSLFEYLCLMPACGVVVVVVSWITYILVELPMIRLGRRPIFSRRGKKCSRCFSLQ